MGSIEASKELSGLSFGLEHKTWHKFTAAIRDATGFPDWFPATQIQEVTITVKDKRSGAVTTSVFTRKTG